MTMLQLTVNSVNYGPQILDDSPILLGLNLNELQNFPKVNLFSKHTSSYSTASIQENILGDNIIQQKKKWPCSQVKWTFTLVLILSTTEGLGSVVELLSKVSEVLVQTPVPHKTTKPSLVWH